MPFALVREDFPSRCELESSLRATKGARAAGVDKLPGEILSLLPPPRPVPFPIGLEDRHEDVRAVAFQGWRFADGMEGQDVER